MLASPSNALEAISVTKCFGGLTAVNDVSFAIGAREVVGLIGPNGAGKTTMFSILAGEIKPTRGMVKFHDICIDCLGAHDIHKLGLARTFQIPRPFRHLTVEENLLVARPGQSGDRFMSALFRPAAIRAEERIAREKAGAILEELDLVSHRNIKAGALSGGQHKLLELARTLMSEPTAILLDEPCAGVSPAMTDRLSEAIDYLRKRGITLVIVEHNIDFVAQHCDRVIVMTDGRIMVDGTPQTVRNDPRVLEAFLGSSLDKVAHG